jgi:16S rRNA (cytosine967-C5)-methyltransferase
MNIMRVKRKCLELISRIEEQGAYSHLVLQQASQSGGLSPEEFPVLLQLTRGVLEQRGVLESHLNPLLPKGLSSLPIEIQHILRLGAYQILFLDRVKKRDVVFEAVELAKGSKYRRLSSLVNAVLRKIGSEDKAQVQEEPKDSTLNFPDWLISRWSEQFGEEEVGEFCRASDDALPVYCRVNTARITATGLKEVLAKDGFESQISEFSPHSLRVTRMPSKKRITSLDAYKDGLFFIQDLSSTIVADIASWTKPASVKDLCAAPGGKACSIALSIGDSGSKVIASDRSPSRVELIKDLIKRLGISNIKASVSDLTKGKRSALDQADLVLLDGPCSGFGTVGRKVDARWTTKEDDLTGLMKLQSELLDSAADFVNPGGYLVYSTCTIDRGENEERIAQFLASRSDFEIVKLDQYLPAELCTDEGFYRSWPHRHKMTGAFGGMLRRRGEI